MKTSLPKLLVACALGALVLFPELAGAESAASSSPNVTLHDFKLVGNLNGDRAAFTLNAIAHVENFKGGSLDLLSGTVALTEVSEHPKWRVRIAQSRFAVDFDRSGDFPIQIKFSAAVRQNDG